MSTNVMQRELSSAEICDQEALLHSLSPFLVADKSLASQLKETLDEFPGCWYHYINTAVVVAATKSRASLQEVIKRIARHGESVIKALPPERKGDWVLGGKPHPTMIFFRELFDDLSLTLK